MLSKRKGRTFPTDFGRMLLTEPNTEILDASNDFDEGTVLLDVFAGC